MKWPFIISALLLLASCQEEKISYPPIWVEDLTEVDSLALRQELLSSFRQEALDWMDKNSEGNNITLCFPINRPFLFIEKNSNSEVIFNGDTLKNRDTIPSMIRDYYLKNWGEKSISKFAPSYWVNGYPFYGPPEYRTLDKNHLIDARLKAIVSLALAYTDQDESRILFYEKSILQYSNQLSMLSSLGKDRSQTMQLFPVVIKNLRYNNPEIFEGIFQIRDSLSYHFFDLSYLNLYLHSKNLNDPLWKKRLDAIHSTRPMSIVDHVYLNSIDAHMKDFLPYSQEYRMDLYTTPINARP